MKSATLAVAAFAATSILWPSLLAADHLKPRLYLLPPKPGQSTGNLVSEVERTGIVNRVKEGSIQFVGQFMFLSQELTGLTCEGDFASVDGAPLAHGDIVRFRHVGGRCEDMTVVSRDPDESRRLEAEMTGAAAPAPEPAASAPETKAEETADGGQQEKLVYVSYPDLPDALPDVATVQRALAALGYDPGPADNVYGQRTGDAIAAFRARHPDLARTPGRDITLELWQNLWAAEKRVTVPVGLGDGREIPFVAAFWITKGADGGHSVLGGARHSPPLGEAHLDKKLEALVPRIDTGSTILLVISQDLAGFVISGRSR